MDTLLWAALIFLFSAGLVQLLKSHGDAKSWREREFEILRPMSFEEWSALTPAQRDAKSRDLDILVRISKRQQCRC
jgi:hypothetical protein